MKENRVEGIYKRERERERDLFFVWLEGKKIKKEIIVFFTYIYFYFYFYIPIIWGGGGELFLGEKYNCAPYFYFSSTFHFDFGDCILWVWIKILLISTFHLYEMDENFNLCHIFPLPFVCSLKLPQSCKLFNGKRRRIWIHHIFIRNNIKYPSLSSFIPLI